MVKVKPATTQSVKRKENPEKAFHAQAEQAAIEKKQQDNRIGAGAAACNMTQAEYDAFMAAHEEKKAKGEDE